MYTLLPDQDQSQIMESVRSFLAAQLPIERWRPNASAGTDDNSCWAQMAELGWFGLGIDEGLGGVGYGFAEEALLLRECGRFLVTPTFMATLLAAHVAAVAGKRDLLQAIIGGRQRVAMAMEASPPDEHDKLGRLYLFDHQPRDLVLVRCDHMLADTPIFLISDASNLSGSRHLSCLDETLSMHAAELTMENSTCLVEDISGLLSARLQAMLAAMLCGLAEASRDLSVEYAKVREQFGQPIGRFQAVKHACTDMAVRAELCWAQTIVACLDVQRRAPQAAAQAAAARLLAADAGHRNAAASVQVHGGIGFQAECSAHHFVKRTHIYDQLGGAAQAQRQKLLARSALL